MSDTKQQLCDGYKKLTEPDFCRLNESGLRLLHAVMLTYAYLRLGLDEKITEDEVALILWDNIGNELGGFDVLWSQRIEAEMNMDHYKFGGGK